MKKATHRTSPVRHLLEMVAFAKVVQTKSFSKAAISLGVTRSVVSKYVAKLEELLRVRLLNRTTRALSLTEAGVAVYEHCERLLAEAENVTRAASDLTSAPRGTLRVSTSVAFGRLEVVPLLPEFLARYPEISIDLMLIDRYVDLAEEGFDVVLRVTEKLAPNLAVKRLGPIEYVVCGSPGYLKRAGIPRTPADLEKHNCLYYYAHQPTAHERWQFEGVNAKVAVTVQGNVRVNGSEALRDMVLADVGLALLPMYAVSEDVKRGRLRAILKQYRAQGVFGTNVYAAYLPSRYGSPKVRAFVDFLADKLRPSLGSSPKRVGTNA